MAAEAGAEGVAAALIALARELASGGSYPPPARLAELTEMAVSALRAEETSVRPRAAAGEPGGLVALGAPFVAVVPDLHARARLLADLLASEPPAAEAALGRPAAQSPARNTVTTIADDLSSGGGNALLSPSMDEEMGLSLSALCLVMLLKANLKAAFHCLKGNHDNLSNSSGDGDSGFRKYALEGAMGAEWSRLRYGEAALDAVRRYELLLPLVATGRAFCASHAEPAFPVTAPDLRNYRSHPALVRALTWTANGQAEEGAVAESLAALLGGRAAGGLWLAGHRPIPGAFGLRADGRLLQIHNPGRNQIAWIDNRAEAGRLEVRFYEVENGGGAMRFLESLAAPS
jgi:hypothetical protein